MSLFSCSPNPLLDMYKALLLVHLLIPAHFLKVFGTGSLQILDVGYWEVVDGDLPCHFWYDCIIVYPHLRDSSQLALLSCV